MVEYGVSVYYGVEIPDPGIDYRRYGLCTYPSGDDKVIVGCFLVALVTSDKGYFHFNEQDFLEHHKGYLRTITRKFRRAGIPILNPSIYYNIHERGQDAHDEF